MRTEASLNNFENAAIAQMSLVKLLGEQVSTEDLYQLAELMVISLNGYVSPEAEALLRKVLSRDNDNGGALYYLGLMYANLDRPDLAFEIWRKLLKKVQIMHHGFRLFVSKLWKWHGELEKINMSFRLKQK